MTISPRKIGVNLRMTNEEYALARGEADQTRGELKESLKESLKAVSDYTRRRYRSNRNRNWWGIAHRAQLLNSGRYIRTSKQDAPRWVGEAGPELVKMTPLRGGGYMKSHLATDDPRLKLAPGEYIINRDGSVWQVSDDGDRVELRHDAT